MRVNFKLIAAALVLIFASSGADAFQLEKKGPAAKWRTDIVKRNNKFTACVMGAYGKCEKAADKVTPNNGALDDCKMNVPGAPTAVGASAVPASALSDLDAALTKCDKIVAEVDLSPAKPKGLNAANPLGFTLADIGCTGDCAAKTACTGAGVPFTCCTGVGTGCDGNQPCPSTAAWKLAEIDPTSNIRDTAQQIIGSFGGLLCGAAPAPGPEANILLATVAKYLASQGACVQKCQDDFVDKAGNGFANDTTACAVGAGLDKAAVPNANFDTCLGKAFSGSIGPMTACGWATNPLKPTLYKLLSGLNNAASNDQYDRIDLESALLGGLFGGVAPLLQNMCVAPGVPLPCCTGAGTGPTCVVTGGQYAASLGGRATPGQRVAYGACASCNDGILSDYEECDSAFVNVCASIPGTAAAGGGNASCLAAGNPFSCCSGAGTGVCQTCPSTDNSSAGIAACRCYR